MPIQTLIRTAAAAVALMAFTSLASAAEYCPLHPDLGANADGMKRSDVTFSSNTPTTSADGCYGIVSGNESQDNINSLGLTWGINWTFLAKDEAGPSATGTFGGITYTLDGYDAATSGTWTLSATPLTSLPVTVDFIVALKGSKEYALWFFEDVTISGDGEGDGVWNSVFTNKNLGLQNLSHMTLYIRGDTSDPPVVIPEPGSLALVGLALLGLGAMRRRRA